MVSGPIIRTKFNIPTSHHRIVPRPRLFQRLNHGQNGKLSLVCAPAGSGKSTLVSSWLLQQEACTVWISLDENDNDWTRFFLYMITALEQSESGMGSSSLEPVSYTHLRAHET